MDTLIFKPSEIILSPILNSVFIINKKYFSDNILNNLFYQTITYSEKCYIFLIDKNDKEKILELMSKNSIKEFIVDNILYRMKDKGLYESKEIDSNLRNALIKTFTWYSIHQVVEVLKWSL